MRYVMLVAFLAPLATHAAAPPSADTRALRVGNARFAGALYGQLSKAEGNLCFSPFSISSALGMLSAGAKGETLAQLERAMHLPPQDKLHPAMKALREGLATRRDGIDLSVANAIWAQAGVPLRPAFTDLLKANHGAGLDMADFAQEPEVSRLMLNRWVSLHTRRKIHDLFPEGSIDPLTRLVLANAVYFKGDWSKKFDKAKTTKQTFHAPGGDVEVPTMTQYAPFAHGEAGAADVVELPFARGDLTLTIAVPKDGRKLADVERDFIDGKLLPALARLETTKVELSLPRFKASSALDLPAALKRMGVVDAFGPKADFSGIDGTKELELKRVFHKAVLEVNEEGGEGAAATGAVVGVRSLSRFKVDRPFLFVLRDRKSGTVLFVGRVIDPTK